MPCNLHGIEAAIPNKACVLSQPFTVAVFWPAGSPGSYPRPTLWNLWRTKWQRHTFYSGGFGFPLSSVPFVCHARYILVANIRVVKYNILHSLTHWPEHVHRIHVVRTSYCKQGKALSGSILNSGEQLEARLTG